MFFKRKPVAVAFTQAGCPLECCDQPLACVKRCRQPDMSQHEPSPWLALRNMQQKPAG